MSKASNLERQMLELINAERTSQGLNTVQLELRLNDSSEEHSEWMLQTDTFSHTGAGGSSAGDRMEDAGFVFSGSWTWAENIAWQSIRGEPGLSDDVVDLHNALMNSSGHRANILNPDVTVIGIGIETGSFDGWNAIMVTQNFARTGAAVQLDGAPEPVEEVVVAAPEPSAPPPQAAEQEPESPIKKYFSKSKTGTDGDDWFVMRKGVSGKLDGKDGDDILVGSSGKNTLLGRDGDDILKAKSGNDKIFAGDGEDRSWGGSGNDRIDGGTGNDTIFGGSGADKLIGGSGIDRILGGKDKDDLRGGLDNDTLIGESGNDKLWGQGGDDILKGGGGNDVLVGGSGDNVLSGGSGADRFVFGSGDDRVTDFQGTDLVDLRKSDGITSFKDLKKNHMEQSGSDVLIEDNQGYSMLLEDTHISNLDIDHFLI